jgi:hypothetical protein
MEEQERCSTRSLEGEEPLAGTASTFRRWLLVEHPGPWGRQGLSDARVPRDVGPKLRRLGSTTGARVLLIRRPDRRVGDTTACFAVDTAGAEPWVGRIDLDRIDDALELDPSVREMFPVASGPLAVVCTHGRRDPCCAERGRPLTSAIAAVFPDATWESTHIGGDRFAGNLLLFPHGLSFGRVEPSQGPGIVRAYLGGRIAPEGFRGRSSEPMPVQAAAVSLRLALKMDGIDDITALRWSVEGDRASAAFATVDGRTFEVELERSLGSPVRLTCHADRAQPPEHWIPRRFSEVS